MRKDTQELFKHIMQQHGIVLVDSELYAIRCLCFDIDKICNCLNLSIHDMHCNLTVGEVKVNPYIPKPE